MEDDTKPDETPDEQPERPPIYCWREPEWPQFCRMPDRSQLLISVCLAEGGSNEDYDWRP